MANRLNNGIWDKNKEEIIRKELNRVQNEANEMLLELGACDDKEIGIELLHAWVRDLLGGSANNNCFG